MTYKSLLFILSSCLTLAFNSCKKEQKRTPLITTSASSQGITDAYVAGVLYSSGDADVTEQGVCYSKFPNPGLTDSKVVCESGKKNFSAHLTNLDPGQRFYAKTYAVNKYGVSFGREIYFDTYTAYFPALNFYNYIQSSGSMVFALSVNQYAPASYTLGVCWSKSSGPTVNSSTLQVATRTTTDPAPFYYTYYPKISNLQVSTLYYARAFVLTSYGIEYSAQSSWYATGTINP